MKLRPLHDWVLVRLEPFKTQHGSLWVPEENQKVRIGTVLRTGPGKHMGLGYAPVGLEAGDKVAFFRWNQEHQQGKQLQSALKDLGDDLALVRLPDILFTWSKDDQVEVE